MTDEEKKLYKAFMDDVRECLEEVEDEPVILVPGDLSEDEMREYLMEQYLVKRPNMSEEEILREIEEWIEAKRNFEAGKYVDYYDKVDEIIMTHASEGKEVIEKAVRECIASEYKRVFPEMSEEQIENRVEEDIKVIIEDDPVTYVINRRMARAQRQERYKKLMGE
ncbi:MAG TPA: hypothetical protein PLM71_11480 [Syntrophorhabdaceae bacterium]|nr:hypothetical protein [Syntrophorhabdaceae bacterium]HPU30915.1 hypothetical protein [Syntrophorhabdaceae bacterium]